MRRAFSFIYEIAALYALVAVIGYLFNDGAWSFPGLALHPFLLVIAIEASQYGLRPALMASFVGLGLYIIGSGGVGTNDSLPILAMLATGILLGMVQEARNKQLREARHELDRSRTEQDRLRQRIQILTEANNELNERILGEVKTVSSFSEIARRLSVLDTNDLYAAICDLINDYLSATRSTVYLLQNGELHLKAAKGFVVVPEDLKRLTDPKNLAWRVVQEKRPMSALDLLKESDNGRGVLNEGQFPILMAAPIIEEGSDEVRGVICVNNLPFSKFHGASTKILGVVARWAGDSLYNAKVVEQLRHKVSQKG